MENPGPLWKKTTVGPFPPQAEGSSGMSEPLSRENVAYIWPCTHPKRYIGSHHAACNGGKAPSHHSMDF